MVRPLITIHRRGAKSAECISLYAFRQAPENIKSYCLWRTETHKECILHKYFQ